jgi:hypothetical protein
LFAGCGPVSGSIYAIFAENPEGIDSNETARDITVCGRTPFRNRELSARIIDVNECFNTRDELNGVRIPLVILGVLTNPGLVDIRLVLFKC